MIYVESERLRLRDWTEADADPFRRMTADPEVMRYFPAPLDATAADEFREAIRAELRDCGYGLYAVERKETNDFIGFVGFHRATFEADFTPCIEIGWRLRRDAWGLGYATEAAAACLEYGFAELGFERVYSFTAEINLPSQNVMRKLGLRFAGEFEHSKLAANSPLRKHVLYAITKAEHAAARLLPPSRG